VTMDGICIAAMKTGEAMILTHFAVELFDLPTQFVSLDHLVTGPFGVGAEQAVDFTHGFNDLALAFFNGNVVFQLESVM